MDSQQSDRSARIRVIEIKDFYADVTGFVIALAASGLLAASGHGGGWMLWVVGIWALVLISHAAKVFVLGGKFDGAWEDRKVRELMERG